MNMMNMKKNGQCFANKSAGLKHGITNIINGRDKLTCPDCRTTYYHYVRKINDKTIGKQECPDCYENFKDLYEEFLEILNS